MAQNIKKIILFLVFLLPVVTLFGPFLVPTLEHDIDITPFYLAFLVLIGLWYCSITHNVRLLGSARTYSLFFIVMLIYACVSLLWVKNLWQSTVSLYFQVIGVAVTLLVAATIKERSSLYNLLDVLTMCLLTILIRVY